MQRIENASLFFTRDYKIIKKGELINSGEITIFYDPMRLSKAYKQVYGGARTGNIYCEYSFDDQEICSLSLIEQHRAPGGSVGSISPKALTFKIPLDATKLTVWFRATYAASVDSYDSNNGSNYIFEILEF